MIIAHQIYPYILSKWPNPVVSCSPFPSYMSSNEGSKYDGTALSNRLCMLNDTYHDSSPGPSY